MILKKPNRFMLKALESGTRHVLSAYTDLGKIYAKMGKDDLAQSKFSDALSKNPNDIGASDDAGNA